MVRCERHYAVQHHDHRIPGHYWDRADVPNHRYLRYREIHIHASLLDIHYRVSAPDIIFTCAVLTKRSFVGRSRSLMTGISLQIITVVFICAYLGVTNGWTTEQIDASPSAKADSTGS